MRAEQLQPLVGVGGQHGVQLRGTRAPRVRAMLRARGARRTPPRGAAHAATVTTVPVRTFRGPEMAILGQNVTLRSNIRLA